MNVAPFRAFLAVCLAVAPLPARSGAIAVSSSGMTSAAAQGPWNPGIPEADPMVTFLLAIAIAAGAWLLIDALFLGDDDEAPASP